MNKKNNFYKFSPNKVYLTDKYLFATIIGQFDERISYAFSANGDIIINNNSSQMHDFRIVDGYLYATGGTLKFSGNDFDFVEKDLLIKYIDNTLIVTIAK